MKVDVNKLLKQCIENTVKEAINELDINELINQHFDLDEHIEEHHIEDMYCLQLMRDDILTNVENITNLKERLRKIETLLEAIKEALK